MTNPRQVEAVCDFVVQGLVERHDGWLDDDPESLALPESMRMVTIDDAHFYVGPDPGEPTTGRQPDADVVLLSSCVATELDDDGAVGVVLQEFSDDPTTPDDLRLSATRARGKQVWLDRRLPVATSFEVLAASLDEFVACALRLRVALAPLDLSSSEEARIRAGSRVHTEPLSWDLIDRTDWSQHPWLSRLETNTDQDLGRHLCLYGLSQEAVELFRRVELQYEHADGSWTTLSMEAPGPMMPARDWERPTIAWFDSSEWLSRGDDPKCPTGRWRARIPTGWVGPPL